MRFACNNCGAHNCNAGRCRICDGGFTEAIRDIPTPTRRGPPELELASPAMDQAMTLEAPGLEALRRRAA